MAAHCVNFIWQNIITINEESDRKKEQKNTHTYDENKHGIITEKEMEEKNKSDTMPFGNNKNMNVYEN